MTPTERSISLPRKVLDDVIDALDRGLGDTDITHIESDHELREAYPIQWASMELNRAVHAADAAARKRRKK